MKAKLAAWKRDPVAFIHDVLVNPETGMPFELYDAQVEFLRRALTLTVASRLPFGEIIYACPKKAGVELKPDGFRLAVKIVEVRSTSWRRNASGAPRRSGCSSADRSRATSGIGPRVPVVRRTCGGNCGVSPAIS